MRWHGFYRRKRTPDGDTEEVTEIKRETDRGDRDKEGDRHGDWDWQIETETEATINNGEGDERVDHGKKGGREGIEPPHECVAAKI